MTFLRPGSSLPVASVAAAVLVAAALATTGCSSRPRSQREANTYIRYVAFEMPGHEHVTLRWSKHRMPLRVSLPRPPAGMFESPDAVYDSVRDGVLDWSDVVEPGLPSFEFVEDPADADIPIVWATEADGDWYIAHCAYDIDAMARRFGVARILVTARWGDRTADLHEVYETLLHEMGHALGLGGHSPDPGDIMYAAIVVGGPTALTERDRATLAALYARPNGSRVLGARSD